MLSAEGAVFPGKTFV